MTLTAERTTTLTPVTTTSTLTVTEVRPVGADTLEITLRAGDGGRLPEWSAGAHIDLHLPSGLIRQYSLCGDRHHSDSYRVAVKRDPHGRGGSAFIHDRLTVGSVLAYGGPRNTFRMFPAPGYLFIAGGIGITPLMPMIDQAERMGRPWQLWALSKTRDAMPYGQELERWGDRIQWIESTITGRCDLRAELDAVLDGQTAVYACGPGNMLTGLAALADKLRLPPAGMRLEHFTAASSGDGGAGDAFEIVLARTGRRVPVPAGKSALDALRGAGQQILASCERGLCGTCEADVTEGVPDHRDSVLAPHEREAGNCMLLCVSRACTPTLTLDL